MSSPGDIGSAAQERGQLDSSLDKAYSRQNDTWGRESAAQTDFTGGVIDQMARGRLEHDIAKKALDVADNCVVKTQGPITRRNGTEWAHWGPRYVDRATHSAWGESFQVSESDPYILVFGTDDARAGYVRFCYKTADCGPTSWKFRNEAYDHTSTHPTFTVTVGNPTLITVGGANPELVTEFMFNDGDVYFDELEGSANVTDLNGRWWTLDRAYGTPVTVTSVVGEHFIRINCTHTFLAGDYVRFTYDSIDKPNCAEWLCGHQKIATVGAGYFTIYADGREAVGVGGLAAVATNLKAEKVTTNTFTIRGHDSTAGSHTALTGWFDHVFELEIPYTWEQVSVMHHSKDNNKLVFTDRYTRSWYIRWDGVEQTTGNDPTPPLWFMRKEFAPRDTDSTANPREGGFLVQAPQNLQYTGGATGPSGEKLYSFSYYITAVSYDGVESYAGQITIDTNELPTAFSYTITWDTDTLIDDTSYVTGQPGEWRIYSLDVETGVHRYRTTILWSAPNSYTETLDPSGWFPIASTVDTTAYSAAPNVALPYKDLGMADESGSTPGGDYFASVAIAEDRMVFVSTVDEPSAYLISRSSQFYNFTGTNQAYPYDVVDDATGIKGRASAQDQSPIESIAVLNDILFMTETAEVRFGPGNQDPITHTTNGQKAQSYNGTNLLQVIRVEDAALYVSNKGPTVRDIRYNTEGLAGASYGGRELTVLGGALLEDRQIIQWAAVGKPESAVVMVLDNGHALWMTYHQEHGVVAFTPFPATTDYRNYKGVMTLSEGTENGIYFVMEQVVLNPNISYTPTETYIERMHTNFLSDDIEQDVYLDAAKIWCSPKVPGLGIAIDGSGYVFLGVDPSVSIPYVAGDWVRIVTENNESWEYGGVEWANSEWEVFGLFGNTWQPKDPVTGLALTVAAPPGSDSPPQDTMWYREIVNSVSGLWGLSEIFTSQTIGLLDAVYYDNLVMSVSTREVTFPGYVAAYVIGRPYSSTIKTLPLTPKLGRNDVFSSPDQVGLVSLRLIKTLGIKLGVNDGELQELKSRTDEPFYSAVREITGDIHQLVYGEWKQGTQIVIQQDLPYAMMISALLPEAWHGEL